MYFQENTLTHLKVSSGDTKVKQNQNSTQNRWKVGSHFVSISNLHTNFGASDSHNSLDCLISDKICGRIMAS